MTVYDLNKDQLVELKQNYLMQHLLEVENRSPSWKEMSDADEIISDEMIFEQYGSTDFPYDDFSEDYEDSENWTCSCGSVTNLVQSVDDWIEVDDMVESDSAISLLKKHKHEVDSDICKDCYIRLRNKVIGL